MTEENKTNLEKAIDLAKNEVAKADQAKAADSKAKEAQAKEAEAKAAADKEVAEKAVNQEANKEGEGNKNEAEKKELTAEEKIAKWQEDTQKRIDELTSEVKSSKHESQKDKETIKALQEQLNSVKAGVDAPSIEAKIEQELSKNITRYIDEDKSKPKDKRREMSKDELEEWYLEDPTEATAWINRRERRRHEEQLDLKKAIAKPSGKESAEEFLREQDKHIAVLVKEFPQVIPDQKRINALKAEGKNDSQIHEILLAENEHYRMLDEITHSEPSKYINRVDGPELARQEIKKRLEQKTNKRTLSEEEIEKIKKEAIEAEDKRRKEVDANVRSSGGSKKVENNKTKSDFRLKQEQLAAKAGLPLAELDKAIERRRTIPGAAVYDDGKE